MAYIFGGPCLPDPRSIRDRHKIFEAVETIVEGRQLIRSRRIQTLGPIAPLRLFDIKESTTGKGFYAVANEDIAQGERVLVEEPLLLFHTSKDVDAGTEEAKLRSIFKHVSVLHPEHMASFRTLHSRLPNSDLSTWYTNATSLGNKDPNRVTTGIYLNYSRLNHSCRPNIMVPLTNVLAHCSLTLVAASDIRKGEEITISYIRQNEWPSARIRQDELQHWGFKCDCVICYGPGTACSDARRDKIRLLKKKLTDWLAEDKKATGQVLAVAEKLHKLVEVELCGRTFDVDGGAVPSYVDQRILDTYEITQRVLLKSDDCEHQRIALAIGDRLRQVEALMTYYKAPKPDSLCTPESQGT